MIEDIGNQSRWRYVLLLLEGEWLDALRNGNGRRRVQILWERRFTCVGKGKARQIRKRKKKNRKRNDPGKAQCINGCGAEVNYCSDEILGGLGQARPVTFQARVRGRGSCKMDFLRESLGRGIHEERERVLREW